MMTARAVAPAATMRIKRLLFEVARVTTLVAVGALIGLFLLNLALTPRRLSDVVDAWTPNITWTPEAAQAALAQLSWSPASMVYLFGVLIPLVVASVNIGLGLLILSRRSRDAMGLFTAFVFVLSGTNGASQSALLQELPALIGMSSVLGGLSWQLSFILFYIFPNGRFVLRWTRWLLLGWLGINIVGWNSAMGSLLIIAVLALVLSPLVSQVYRYFWHANAIERKQTKWVVFAVVIMLMILLPALLPFVAPQLFLADLRVGMIWTLVIRMITPLAQLLLPISITVAILRYRLFDIDVIIRRTLVYGVLTALLVLLFFAGVTALQQLSVRLTGQQSDLALVISTLVIAALALPLRNRVQSVIDRCFYRRKYDAQQALAAFSVRLQLQQETDVGGIAHEVDAVMRQTLQPRSVRVLLVQLLDTPKP